ncbi:MAG: winged helix-turn-helix domain-containing protein [Myxococcota bacterium]
MSTLELKTATVDLTFLRVARGADEDRLTESEAVVLRFLVANRRRDVSRDELVGALGRASSHRAVDITVARLRSKLGEPRFPNHIRTVRGVGYRFVDDEPPPLVSGSGPVGRPPIPIPTGELDLDRRVFVAASGEIRPLGKLDAELLERLADGAGVPRAALTREIWGRGRHERSLTAALRRLRERIDDDPHHPRVVVALPGSVIRLERRDDRWELRTNLRPSDSTFVERREVGALFARLGAPTDPRRPITLRGPAGIGKTRLAVECGRRLLAAHPTLEVWFCDLSCALAEHGIRRAVEAALGLEGGLEPSSDRMVRVLARKPVGTVLILDNFDQVTDHAQALEDWLRRAPNVRCLVTSRHALGIPGEVVIDLEPLEVEAAARLFADRATAAVDPSAPSVRSLVGRLDGLPLSIELAAARAAEFTPEEMLDRLGDRLSWMVRSPAGASSPHRSLRGALDWSWDLLDEGARIAFAECSVFARTFSTPLAEQVLSSPQVALTLQHLAERSLLQRVAPSSAGGGGGWRLLEGLRDYAREKAILLGRWDPARTRHADSCIGAARSVADGLHGRSDSRASLTALRELRADLLVVRTEARSPEHRIGAALALAPLLKADGPRELAAAVCADAIALDPPPAQAWRLWLARGELERLAERHAAAEPALRRAVEHAAAAGEPARSIASARLADALIDSGRYAEAEARLMEALGALRAAGDARRATSVTRSLARLRAATGRTGEALEQLEQVVREVELAPDPLRAYYVHRDLQEMYLGAGDLDRAEAHLENALRWAEPLELRRAEFEAQRQMAAIARRRGHPDRAVDLLEEAASGFEANGDDALARLIRRNRALVAIEADRLELAERLLEDACAGPETELAVLDRGNLAIVWHLQGRFEAATRALRRLVDPTEPDALRCGLLAHLAAAAADDGDPDSALSALTQARALVVPPLAPLVEVLGRVVELGLARAGRADRAAATASAEATLAAVSGAPERADQDLHFASKILRASLARA